MYCLEFFLPLSHVSDIKVMIMHLYGLHIYSINLILNECHQFVQQKRSEQQKNYQVCQGEDLAGEGDKAGANFRHSRWVDQTALCNASQALLDVS